MRSQASSSEIKTIVRDNFKKFWTVPAFGLFWFLVWGLIPVLLGSSEGMMDDLAALASNTNIGYPIAILFVPLISGMTVFSFLQNPSSANYMHSLPLSRGKLFGANVLSGLLMIAAPIVVNGIIMTICAGNLMFVKWMVVTFVCCAAIFAITVFAAMISGNTLMHLFNACFFNGVLALLLMVFIDLSDAMLLGYETPDAIMTFLLRSNALTASIGESSRVLICAVYLAVTIAALLIAWAIYRKRPIERTGDSVIFSWTRALLFLICVFSGSMLAGLFNATIMSGNSIKFDHNMIIGMVIGALAVFVIGSILIDRSARIFTKRNLLPAAIALALAFAVSGAVNADVFGYCKYVPDAGDVKSVYMDATNSVLFTVYDDEGWGSAFRGNAGYYKDVKDVREINDENYPGFSSEESIEAITALQQTLIDQKREGMDYYDGVRIIYELKNGKTVRRSYDIYVTPDSNEMATDLDPKIREAAAALYDSKEFRTVYSLNNLKPEYFEKGSIQFYDDPFGEGEQFAISNEDAKELKAAMEKDFQKLGYDKAMQYSGEISVSRKSTPLMEEAAGEYRLEVLELPIPKTAKNTRGWLRENGYSVK
ncbi:MAG: hypothetical protein IJI74_00805 [Firmicutes bacterium]|nr:hypothetical protein [Bacillota bacterium]